MEERFGIYVHIPFCPARCSYCDFPIAIRPDDEQHQAYTAAVILEWEGENLPPGKPVSLYFGGGTPSMLAPERIGAIIRAITERCSLDEGAEITLEANPGTVDRSRLKAFRGAGVNRLSIGAQAWQNRHLAAIGRTHRPEDITAAVRDARTAGFDNLSLDAIYGLPGQTLAQWEETLSALLAFEPEHLSLYQLQVEAGTPLFTAVHRGDLQLPDPDRTADMADMAQVRLERAGLERYEISNFARPGYASRHNQLYWSLDPYVAVGMGAHSYRPGRRWWNVGALSLYLHRVQSGVDPMLGEEALDAAAEMREMLWLGLRRTAGVSRKRFGLRFGSDPIRVFGPVFARLEDAGLVTVSPETIRLSPRGRDLANRVAMELVDAPLTVHPCGKSQVY